MAGTSVSLVDFLEDALPSFSYSSSDTTTSATSSDSDSMTIATSTTSTGSRQRFIAVLLALGLPLGFACAYPRAFLGALENAALIGGVSLYGIVPALVVLRLRSLGVADDTIRLLLMRRRARSETLGRCLVNYRVGCWRFMGLWCYR